MSERFEIYIAYKRCYINTLPFLFLSLHATQLTAIHRRLRFTLPWCMAPTKEIHIELVTKTPIVSSHGWRFVYAHG